MRYLLYVLVYFVLIGLIYTILLMQNKISKTNEKSKQTYDYKLKGTNNSLSNLVYKLLPERYIHNTNLGLMKAGNPYGLNVLNYIILRFSIPFITYIFFIGRIPYGYVLSIPLAISMYYIIHFIVINNNQKKRTVQLEKEMLFFFEILSLSIESGSGFENGLFITCEKVEGSISMEFKKTLNEVKLGKSLAEAINDMRQRIPSKIIDNILLTLLQSIRMGTSIVNTLHNQLDYLREARYMKAREEVGKMPNKMSVIGVFFMLPSLLTLILGPVILQQFFNK